MTSLITTCISTWKLFVDDTFNNCVPYEKLATLIGGLTLINPWYEYWKLMFRSTLYAQPQTTDLLPGDLHHALLSVQRWLIVIRCLLKCILVFDTFRSAREIDKAWRRDWTPFIREIGGNTIIKRHSTSRSSRCSFNTSIDKCKRIGTGLLFPSLTVTIPIRTCPITKSNWQKLSAVKLPFYSFKLFEKKIYPNGDWGYGAALLNCVCWSIANGALF